jgi:hypothetical protein
MTDNLWICRICGYELAKKSDVLKICPNCNGLRSFIVSKKFYVVCKILPNLHNNLLFSETYLPLIIFNTVEQAQNFIFELPAMNQYKIKWVLEDKFNEYINRGIQYVNID